jgi:hypothetical protein
MMSRTQVTLKPETQRQARRRANDLGISLAEYIRRLVVRDLGEPTVTADPSLIFDLGRSNGSDISTKKDSMIAEAIAGSMTRKSHV